MVVQQGQIRRIGSMIKTLLWMGDDSHFVLQFSSLFSVGMYICSVLQVLAWQEEYERVIQENVNLRAQLEAM